MKAYILVIGALVCIVSFLLTFYISQIEFDYKLDQCNKLSSTETNYGFTNTIETNAQYNSNCYWLRNHPLAKFYYIYLLSILVSVVLGFFVMFMIHQLTMDYGV